MGKRVGLRNKLCVSCGAPASSRDHVPPKELLSKPYPKNLITVPSCGDCNNGASRDDEYLRNTLLLRIETADHPEALKLRPRFYRGFFDAQHPGARREVLRKLKPVRLVSPAGLSLGRTASFEVEVPRIHRVIRRIVYGLYFRTRGERLPDGCVIDVYPGDAVAGDVSADGELLRALGGTVLIRGRQRTIGAEAFSYWFYDAREQEDCDRLGPHDTVWMLRFYGAVDYLCITRTGDVGIPEVASTEESITPEVAP